MSVQTSVVHWLQSHSSTTPQLISREFSLTVAESRALLIEAVNAIGPELYCLTFINKQQDFEGNWTLVKTETSDQGLLYSVQLRSEPTKACEVEKSFNRLRLLRANSMQTLYRHEAANIAPLNQLPRNTCKPMPPQIKAEPNTLKDTASIKRPDVPKKPTAGPRQGCLVMPPAPARDLKTEAEKAAKVKAETVRTTQAKLGAEMTSKLKIDGERATKVKFETSLSDKESTIKRTSTPHPAKSVGKSDCLAEIMKSNLYTVEEDYDPRPSHDIVKRKHSPDTSNCKRIKVEPQEEAPAPVQDLGPSYRIVKKKTTKTYMNEKGRLGKR